MLPKKYFDNLMEGFMDEHVMDFMRCDVYEKEDVCYIVADMPGLAKENVRVECNNGYLTITGTKEENKEENDGKRFIQKERFYGEITRKFHVGDVEEDAIEAEFKDGVLTIVIPKKDKEKNKKIIDIK